MATEQTVRADVSRGTQIGVQSAFGTGVNTNLRFPSMRFARPKIDKKGMRAVTPSTYKAPTGQVGGKESTVWGGATSDGITFGEMVYVLETCVKTVVPTTSDTSAKTRVIAPSPTAQDTRKFLTIEDGQVGNFWKAIDAFFSGFNLKSNPDGVDFTASLMGNDITVPAGFSSASPTTISNKPILVERVGVFTADTFANLAASPVAVDNPIECELDFAGLAAAYFRLKQGERGYAGTIDGTPALKVRLVVAVDQIPASYLLTFTATGGTFTVSYGGQTTAAQTYSAAYAAATLQTAVRALTSVGASSTVTGAAGGPFTITIIAPATTGSRVTVDGSLLTGGSYTLAETGPGELSGTVFNLADWRAGTVRFLRWQAKTSDFIGTTVPWELTFDMALTVGEPFTLGTGPAGEAIIEFPCTVSVDSLGNWLSIKSVSTIGAL